MELPTHVQEALSRPAGAVFHRCALQVNPWAYLVDHNKVPAGYEDEDAYHEALVQAAEASGIAVLGLADHNRARSGRGLIELAAERGIHVLPGFETSSSEGIHVIVLFDVGTSLDEIEQRIATVRDLDGELSHPGPHSFLELVRQVTAWGALPIAAHINGDNGLWTTLSGQSRVTAWTASDLPAVGLSKKPDDIDPGLRAALENRPGSEYDRDRPLALLHAADVNTPAQLADEASWTAMKMVSPSLEGLRQAMLDPASRIRLPHEVTLSARPHVRVVGWDGGFLDRVAFPLSGGLNALIGGRGAGKSTVLESIAYALGHRPSNDESARIQAEIVNDVLGEGTTIWLVVEPEDPNLSTCVVSRTVGQAAQVATMSGDPVGLAPRDLLGGVEAFGQREVALIASRPTARRPLIDRFLDHIDLDRRVQQLQKQLADNRSAIDEAEAQLEALTEDVQRLDELRQRHDRYAELDVEEKSRREAAFARDERSLERTDDVLARVGDASDDLRAITPLEIGFLAPAQRSPAAQHLSDARDAVLELQQTIQDAAADLDKAVEVARGKLRAIRSAFAPQRAEAKNAYLALLRELGTDGPDKAFVALADEIARLLPAEGRHARASEAVAEYRLRRGELLQELTRAYADRTDELRRAATALSRSAGQHLVRVRIGRGEDRRSLDRLLKEHVAGRIKDAVDRIAEAGWDPIELVRCCREGPEAMEAVAPDIPAKQIEKLCQLPEPILRRLEEAELGDVVHVDLNLAQRGDPPDWRPIERLSTGQKATAVLMLLLAHATIPLVIDQPEDDLDNAFITEGVVPRIRDAKLSRQLIVATHNANLPVLGDAEQIVVLNADDKRARVADGGEGALDTPSVAEHVKRLLEGGREAFVNRQRRYGF